MPKRIITADHAYFITARLIQGLNVFSNDRCCELLIEDLNYYRKELVFLIYGFVIMPDHFHWIIHPDNKANISVVMNKVKGHSAFRINEHLKRSGQLWQKGFHDHVIRNGKDFEEKVVYIHKNPYRAGLVQDLGAYKYSSYRNYYCGDEKIMKIDVPKYSIMALSHSA